MAIDWLWTPKEKSGVAPVIGDQYIAMGRQVLCLRNPWSADSAFMAKMYTTSIFGWIIIFTWIILDLSSQGNDIDLIYIIIAIFAPAILISLFLIYRIYFIKNQSNFYFNRKTQKVYFRKGKTLLVGDWSKVQAGFHGRTEFSGRSFSTTFSLALNIFNSDLQNPPTAQPSPAHILLLDSNEPSDPRPLFVAQLWEYIRQFMAQGPEGLPIPQEPHWWYIPHNTICLTPAQAFRHYAPWLTGEPGERQGKKWWLMPFWLLTFPYNLFAALCWWTTCRLLRVRPAEPPAEALEGEDAPLITLEMAISGMRP